MRIQVRRGAFETNSSTNHTLCIVKPDENRLKSEEFLASLPEKIAVPCFSKDEVIDKLNEIAVHLDDKPISDLPHDVRATIMAVAAITSSETYVFLGKLLDIKKALAEVGVEMEVDLDALCYISDNNYFSYDEWEILKELDEKETRALLFSDECRYACWSDDCCASDDLYDALQDRIYELSKTRPNDFYVFHERC